MLLLQLLVLLIEVLQALCEHQISLSAHSLLLVHLSKVQVAFQSVEVLVTIDRFRYVKCLLMALNRLVLLPFLDENGCHLYVVLEHDFIVGLVRLLVGQAVGGLVVVEGLLQEEHAFRLVVVSAQFSVLACQAQAQLAVVCVVQNLVY